MINKKEVEKLTNNKEILDNFFAFNALTKGEDYNLLTSQKPYELYIEEDFLGLIYRSDIAYADIWFCSNGEILIGIQKYATKEYECWSYLNSNDYSYSICKIKEYMGLL